MTIEKNPPRTNKWVWQDYSMEVDSMQGTMTSPYISDDNLILKF